MHSVNVLSGLESIVKKLDTVVTKDEIEQAVQHAIQGATKGLQDAIRLEHRRLCDEIKDLMRPGVLKSEQIEGAEPNSMPRDVQAPSSPSFTNAARYQDAKLEELHHAHSEIQESLVELQVKSDKQHELITKVREVKEVHQELTAKVKDLKLEVGKFNKSPQPSLKSGNTSPICPTPDARGIQCDRAPAQKEVKPEVGEFNDIHKQPLFNSSPASTRSPTFTPDSRVSKFEKITEEKGGQFDDCMLSFSNTQTEPVQLSSPTLDARGEQPESAPRQSSFRRPSTRTMWKIAVSGTQDKLGERHRKSKLMKSATLNLSRMSTYDQIASCASHKRDASRKISRHIEETNRFVAKPMQDVLFEGAGMDVLLQKSSDVKPLFDSFCEELAECLQEFSGTDCVAVLPKSVKGAKRAEEKVNIDYHGNVALLLDSLRATLVLNSSHPDVLDDIYDFFNVFVGAGTVDRNRHCVARIQEVMRHYQAKVVYFKDRYVQPKGSYRDWLFRIRVAGLVAEMQVNFDVAMQVKETTEHKKYEDARKTSGGLLQACMRGDEVVAMGFLAIGAGTLVSDSSGLTPLHYAAFHGFVPLVKKLLESNADPFAGDNENLLPINRAVEWKHAEVVTELIDVMNERSEEILLLPDARKTAFLQAWSVAVSQGHDGDSKLADRIYQLFSGAVPSLDEQLILAASVGDDAACRRISELGGSINAFMFHCDEAISVTPLDAAILAGDKNTAMTCVDLGGRLRHAGPHCLPQEQAEYYIVRRMPAQLAALLAVDSRGPLHCSDHTLKSAQVPQHLQKWGEAPGTPCQINRLVHKAIENKAFRCFRELCDSRDVVAVVNEDRTLEPKLEAMLAVAAGKGDMSAVQLLLSLGVDVDAMNVHGRTPLFIAAGAGHAAICNCLMSARASPTKVSGGPNMTQALKTPTVFAAEYGRLAVLEAFYDFVGSSCFTGCSELGVSASTIAARKGHVPVLRYLKKIGISLDEPDKKHTPLMAAVESCQLRAGRFLVESKVDVDRVMNEMTALDLAYANSNSGKPGAAQVFEELKSIGAKHASELQGIA